MKTIVKVRSEQVFDPETGDYRWLRKEYEKYILEEEDRTYFVVHVPIHQAYLNLQSVPPDRTINRIVNEVLQTLPVFCAIFYKEIKKRPNSSYQEFAKILVKEEQPFQKRYRFLKITASFPAKTPPNLVTG